MGSLLFLDFMTGTVCVEPMTYVLMPFVQVLRQSLCGRCLVQFVILVGVL